MQDTQNSPLEEEQGEQMQKVNVPRQMKNAKHSEDPGTEGYGSPEITLWTPKSESTDLTCF